MNDFDYENLQKKRIAQSAYHRVGQTKKCTLPSDNLTAAQKKALNGQVQSYKLDEPMDYKSFRKMPDDLQKKYIGNLQNLYQASDTMIAQLFGVSDSMGYVIRKGLGLPALDKKRPTQAVIEKRKAKWAAFLGGVVGGKPRAEDPVADDPEEEETAVETLEVPNPPALIGFGDRSTPPREKKKMDTTKIQIALDGVFSEDKIRDWLKIASSVFSGKDVHVELFVEEMEDEDDE